MELKIMENKSEKIEVKINAMAQYAGYKKIEATFITVKDLLGTDAGSEEECLKHNVKQINMLPRDEKGKLRIKPTWIRASLRDTSNVYGLSANMPLAYIYDYEAEVIDGKNLKSYVKSITIMPKDKGIKQGRIATYEILPKGLKFKISCLIPTTGARGVKPTVFKKWIELAFRQGIGSMRKCEFGVCELTDFKVYNLM